MSTLPAVITNLISTLIDAQKATPASTGGDFQFLKMTKNGEWVYGAEETEVGADSAFVIDPMSYAQGYVAWDEGELVDEKMAAAGQAPIILSDLPRLNVGQWEAQVAFALKGVEGAEEGVQLLYKVSSRGGKTAVAELLAKIIERGRAGNADVCPIVLLEKSSYKHKKYGKIYTPVLSVDEWIDLPTGEDTAEPEPEPEPVKKAVARKTRKTEPEPEPVEEEEEEDEPAEEPVRRRRRRTAA